jgi:hypothetical protein
VQRADAMTAVRSRTVVMLGRPAVVMPLAVAMACSPVVPGVVVMARGPHAGRHRCVESGAAARRLGTGGRHRGEGRHGDQRDHQQ